MRTKNEKGFNLIELMIVVTIVAILAAVAYPSYEEQVRRARRTDGQTGLLELVNLMEHYYTENNTYVGADDPADVGGPAVSREGFYNMTISNVTATTFTVSAAPVGGGPQDGDSCGTLTLTHTNIKGPMPDTCW
jgi:type IV pilus assembly protein PilE